MTCKHGHYYRETGNGTRFLIDPGVLISVLKEFLPHGAEGDTELIIPTVAWKLSVAKDPKSETLKLSAKRHKFTP